MVGAEEHYRQLLVQQKSSKSSCQGCKIRASSCPIVCRVQVKDLGVGRIFWRTWCYWTLGEGFNRKDGVLPPSPVLGADSFFADDFHARSHRRCVATPVVLLFSYCQLLAFPPPLIVVTIFPRRHCHLLQKCRW